MQTVLAPSVLFEKEGDEVAGKRRGRFLTKVPEIKKGVTPGAPGLPRTVHDFSLGNRLARRVEAHRFPEPREPPRKIGRDVAIAAQAIERHFKRVIELLLIEQRNVGRVVQCPAPDVCHERFRDVFGRRHPAIPIAQQRHEERAAPVDFVQTCVEGAPLLRVVMRWAPPSCFSRTVRNCVALSLPRSPVQAADTNSRVTMRYRQQSRKDHR